MVAANPLPRMTADEFLAWEREQLERHEYWRGEVFAMSGGTPRHARLATRFASLLDRQLGGGRCATYSSDLRLSLVDNRIVYADVAVVCGAPELRARTRDTVLNPTVVVEVLSKGTEAHDRGDKLAAYVATPAIRHVVFVSQRFARVEVYSRADDGTMTYVVASPGQTVALAHVAATVAVDELYDGAFAIPGDDDEALPA